MQLLRSHTLKSFFLNLGFLLVLFINSITVNAQNYSDFVNENDPGLKAITGLLLSDEYLKSDLDSAKLIAEILILEEEEISQIVSKEILGSYYLRTGNPEKSLNLLSNALHQFARLKDWNNTSECLNELGNAFLLLNELDEAKVAFKSSIEKGKLSSDPTASYNGEIGLGRIALLQNDTLQSIQYLKSYLSKSKEDKKWDAVSNVYGLLAQLEDNRNRELAWYYYQKSIDFGSKSHSLIFRSNVYSNRAILNYDKGNIEQARKDFISALHYREEAKHSPLIIDALYNLGSFEYMVGESEVAIEYFRKSIDLSSASGYYQRELDAYMYLVDIMNESDETKYEIERLKNLIASKKGKDDELMELLVNDPIKVVEEKKSSENSWIVFGLIIILLGSFILVLSKD